MPSYLYVDTAFIFNIGIKHDSVNKVLIKYWCSFLNKVLLFIIANILSLIFCFLVCFIA